ncbi:MULTISPECIES: TIGR03749 family integrating conjugative element protein [unclassified Serratia (in: enterobacteria)]|uniref:TIGR03749 family integrating conjugative element protein n=1 Tax=unclassified Serratia (in: enterobacteria) TaxID=2647522 RepID=UPI00307641E8
MKRILMLLPFFCLSHAAHALEILHWERLPLAVPLQVGQERVIFIERNIRVGVPAALGSRLRVQSAGGALYLRAAEPIEPTRLQLQDADDGTLILLDIATLPVKENAPALEPVRIVENTQPKFYGGEAPAEEGSSEEEDATPPPRRETPIPVVLTRYAAQSLYAPLRTVEALPGIRTVRVSKGLALDTLLPTLPVEANALIAWRLEDYHVTAVRLTNRSRTPQVLDPRALQGDFVAATFQHPDLGPQGTAADTTVVYLVTRHQGLEGTLLPRISPVDAARNLPAGGHHEK